MKISSPTVLNCDFLFLEVFGTNKTLWFHPPLSSKKQNKQKKGKHNQHTNCIRIHPIIWWTSTSTGTLVKGAKQLVVQEALETSTSPATSKGGRWVVEVEKNILEVGS